MRFLIELPLNSGILGFRGAVVPSQFQDIRPFWEPSKAPQGGLGELLPEREDGGEEKMATKDVRELTEEERKLSPEEQTMGLQGAKAGDYLDEHYHDLEEQAKNQRCKWIGIGFPDDHLIIELGESGAAVRQRLIEKHYTLKQIGFCFVIEPFD